MPYVYEQHPVFTNQQAGSKPMREIVARLLAFGEFEVFTFGDKVWLQCVEESYSNVCRKLVNTQQVAVLLHGGVYQQALQC